MRRLYLQIYLTVLGILLTFALLVSALWAFGPASVGEERLRRGIANLLAEQLPADPAEAEALLLRIDDELGFQLTLRAADGRLLATSGPPLALPPPEQRSGGFVRPRGPHSAALELADGRWLLARSRRDEHGWGWLLALLLLLALVGCGAYPLVRRVTRRLERLEAGVERLGRGDLQARVAVEGSDEVADLARAFNRAANRIEELVASQRTALATASHELRTPLARIRMAIELMEQDPRSEIRERAERDIRELDLLIDELLVASRLETLQADALRREPVDLLGLVAEEAARTGAELHGEPVLVEADPRLLRRLVRNLLENARRHAAGSAVEVTVRAEPDAGARLFVDDRGPGVPAGERESIFEPFYRSPARGGGERGSGLGLSLVRRIARHHGGDARCLAREGGGSRFEVVLGKG